MTMVSRTWRWPTMNSTASFGCCWAEAMAPSSRRRASVWAAGLYPWPWAISMAMGSPTWRWPTITTTARGRSWGAAAMASWRPGRPRRWGGEVRTGAWGGWVGAGGGVSGNYGSKGTVSVLLGNGDGTFQPAQSFAAGSYARAVAVGDFNGDGRPDLVVANYYNNDVSVLLGNGDGTFQAARTLAAGG